MAEVTVVIPALNEAGVLPRTLEALRTAEADLQVIVVDGGSTDGTPDLARAFPEVRFLSSPKGRGRQMNAGAAVASGEILWFLHADTRVTPEGIREMRERMRDPSVVGGAFRFAVDSPRARYRWLERGVRFRSGFLGLPYGDQALFVRREVFRQLGGFPDWPLMEDVALVRSLRRAGGFALLSEPALTSARRWEREGILSTSTRNLWLVTTCLMGRSPASMGER